MDGTRIYVDPFSRPLPDGSPELVIAAVDTTNDEPTVVALPLGLQSPEADWTVALDRGSHPSDPAFAALDDSSGSVVLTTVDRTVVI